MNINEAELLLRNHNIIVNDINSLTGSFNKDIFLINNTYVLRPSLVDMQKEQQNFKRIEHLLNVPKIEYMGKFKTNEDYYYTILNMLPGIDFIDAVSDMTLQQQKELGASISNFLNILHGITNTEYDIGHYLPLIPNYSGSWKSGHKKYSDYLFERTEKMQLNVNSCHIITQAFQYLNSYADVLDYQSGPVLLHNDFHPKNIVVNNGMFSGVIDWECSQFGESDFEMCHFIHWCLYPPKQDVDFKPFLRSLFNASPQCVMVPGIARRLTIYQIEHELIQLIWSNGKSEVDRTQKIIKWLAGSVDDLLNSL